MHEVADDNQVLFEIPIEMELRKSEGGERRIVRGYASTENMDQDGEIILQNGIDFSPLLKSGYLNYDHNPNVCVTGAKYVGAARRKWLAREWRRVSSREDTVQDVYPWATDLGPIDTVLIDREDAQALCDKMLDLYKVKRETMQITIGPQGFLLNLGDVVRVVRPSYGLDANFRILGTENDFSSNRCRLTLWR